VALQHAASAGANRRHRPGPRQRTGGHASCWHATGHRPAYMHRVLSRICLKLQTSRDIIGRPIGSTNKERPPREFAPGGGAERLTKLSSATRRR
jgi:hypothetical protein